MESNIIDNNINNHNNIYISEIYNGSCCIVFNISMARDASGDVDYGDGTLKLKQWLVMHCYQFIDGS